MKADKNDWLKKSLQDKFDSEHAPVGEELWGKIKPRVQEKKKDRKATWVWFLFGALGLGALGLGLWNGWWITNSVTERSTIVDQQESKQEADEQNEIAIFENESLDENETLRENDESLININSKNLEEVNEGKKSERAVRNTALLNAEGTIVQNTISSVENAKVPTAIDFDNTNSSNSTTEALAETATKIDTNTLIGGFSGNSSVNSQSTNPSAGDDNFFLLTSKIDSLSFNRLFDFRSRHMNMKEKPLPKRSGWYVSGAFSRHRQLVYPNLNDNLLFRNGSNIHGIDTSSGAGIKQWGVEIEFGKTFEFSDKLEGFGAITLGMKKMRFTYDGEYRNFNFDEVEVVDINTIRLKPSRSYEFASRSTTLFYPGVKLGVLYQPFKRVPIKLTSGAFGRWHFFSFREETNNQFEVGAFAGIAWDIDKKKRFQLNLHTELSLNKIDFGIYQTRIQAGQVGLNYNF